MFVMSAVALWVWNHSPLGLGALNLASAALIATIVYLLLLVALQLIDRHDAARVPVFGRFFRPRRTSISLTCDRRKAYPYGRCCRRIRA